MKTSARARGYTRQLMRLMGGYTFVIALLVFLLVWGYQESLEQEEAEQARAARIALLQLFDQAQQSPLKVASDAHFSLYLPGAAMPEYAPSSVQQVPLINGQQALLVPQQAPPVALEGEFDDLLLVLAAVLACTGLSLWLVSWLARRLADPVVQLDAALQSFVPGQALPELPLLTREDELGALARSFASMMARVQAYMAREQSFTRFASHELRSPITVMRGNLELLHGQLPEGDLNRRIEQRLNNAVGRMSELVEVFLWLGRETERPFSDSQVFSQREITHLIHSLLADQRAEPDIDYHLESTIVNWLLPEPLLRIVLDNLLRNALRHGRPPLDIRVHTQGIVVKNPLAEQSAQEGSGYGLELVGRICERLGWQLVLREQPQAFTAEIRFSRAESDPSTQPQPPK